MFRMESAHEWAWTEEAEGAETLALCRAFGDVVAGIEACAVCQDCRTDEKPVPEGHT